MHLATAHSLHVPTTQGAVRLGRTRTRLWEAQGSPDGDAFAREVRAELRARADATGRMVELYAADGYVLAAVEPRS